MGQILEHSRTSRKDTSLVVKNLKDLTKNQILDFCIFASSFKEDPAHVNMYHKNWEDHPETLPYLVFISHRFAKGNGEFFVLLEDEKIIGISGIHISAFDKNVALGGVRTWLPKKYRGKFLVGRYLLPRQLAWAKQQHLKTIALTFNEYNKNLIPYFTRTGVSISKKRNPNSMFYKGVNVVNFPCNIQYTKQWIIYDKIDLDYEPDWESIRWHV